MKAIRLLFLWSTAGLLFPVNAQEYKCYTCETGYDGGVFEIFTLHDSVVVTETVYDTVYISELNDLTGHFNMSFDEFFHSFSEYIRSRDTVKRSPAETVYLSDIQATLHAYIRKYRYVLSEYQVDFSKDRFKIHKNEKILPDNLHDSMPLDIMFTLQGKLNTTNFLKTPNQQVRVVYKIFSDIVNASYRNRYKKVGVNFYFPDFSFHEKRAMAQFVKSVSLVVDSTRIPEIRNLPLYFTFDTEEGKNNQSYLVGLSSMVDSVFLATPDASMALTFESLHSKETLDIPWMKQLLNQFYLARFDTGDFPETSDQALLIEDVKILMNADYPDAYWEYYLLSIFGILFILLIGSMCYIFLPSFANFVHEYSMYVFAGGILLVLEIYLLFVFMVESMSNTVVFSFQNNNTMLLLPVMLIFVIPLIKKVIRTRENP